jgi:large subunit ribosomal protein LP0
MPAKARSTRTKDEVTTKKSDYILKVVQCLEEYPRFLVVTCDFIGSKHMQQIRLSLRASGSILLMGKNTLMRKAIRTKLDEHPEWDAILPTIKHNVGIVLTKGSLTALRDKLLESTVPAIAKAGILAPDDVILPKQVTALEPTKTSFFAALDIATKITRGCVEILNDVKLCDKGKKVGSSEAALLQMLDIKPFTYGLKVTSCWEGSVFAPAFLDFTEDNLFKSIAVGINQVASLSLGLSYPTLPAFKHVVVNGFRNLVAVCLETGYTFKAMEEIKKRVENPDAYAVAAPVQEKKEVKKEVKKEEPKVEVKKEEEPEEEDVGGLMDFF